MKALIYIGGGAILGGIAASLIFLVLGAISPMLGGAFLGYLVYKIVTY